MCAAVPFWGNSRQLLPPRGVYVLTELVSLFKCGNPNVSTKFALGAVKIRANVKSMGLFYLSDKRTSSARSIKKVTAHLSILNKPHDLTPPHSCGFFFLSRRRRRRSMPENNAALTKKNIALRRNNGCQHQHFNETLHLDS